MSIFNRIASYFNKKTECYLSDSNYEVILADIIIPALSVLKEIGERCVQMNEEFMKTEHTYDEWKAFVAKIHEYYMLEVYRLNIMLSTDSPETKSMSPEQKKRLISLITNEYNTGMKELYADVSSNMKKVTFVK